MRRTLVIFTHGAPFCNIENAFLMPELPLLARRYDRVVLVPDRICHQPDFSQPVDLPNNVLVYKSDNLKPRNEIRSQLRGLFSTVWMKDLFRFRRPSHLRSALAYVNEARLFKKNFRRLVNDLAIRFDETLFYSFWMMHESSGLAELAKCDRSIVFMTRAHGYDLYDERVNFRSRYYRELTFRMAKAVYCCSRNGVNYLNRKYPGHEAVLRTGYLGIECPAEDCVSKALRTKNNLRILTVASLVDVKQLPRFLISLADAAQSRSELQLHYRIVGEGPSRGRLEEIIRTCPPNLQVELAGAVVNSEVLADYAKDPPDIFALPSRSEGLSMAAMEALVRGVPVWATDVGGMGEIVIPEKTGWLMSPDFTSEDVCRILDEVVAADLPSLGRQARQFVRSIFDRQIVRKRFADEIASL